MKIRQGFVSNSSSSSFLIVASASVFDDVFAELHPLEKAVVSEFIFNGKVGNLFIKGLSYGIDLNGDTTSCMISDAVFSYKSKHPNDDYSKFDNMYTPTKPGDWCEDPYGWDILERFQDSIVALANIRGEGIVRHTEGNG